MRKQPKFGKTGKEVLSRLKSGTPALATVSGILTTNPETIRMIDTRIPEIAVITTKSYQLDENKGYREPVVAEPEQGCFVNAVGLKNPGMEKGYAGLRALREKHAMRALLNVSLAGNSPAEFVRLAQRFEDVADMLELNFSCPHASGGYGMSIGTDPDTVFAYVKEIRKATSAPLFPKLTPNVEDLGAVTAAALEAGADGIVGMNTFGPVSVTEPCSGQPVFMNPRGNLGGKSGRWIREDTLKNVAEIRRAAGPDVPIIGMGGIETGSHVLAMKAAGADVVGIGSVFASVHPRQWELYFSALLRDVRESTGSVSRFLTKKRQMEYRPFKIRRIEDRPGELRLMELEGSLQFDAGQFVFLWIPGVGEKPFSVASSSPLRFVLRKRGPVSGALLDLKEGDELYIRGVYGGKAPVCGKRKAWIAAGGTGIAVAPKLAETLAGEGRTVHTFYGAAEPGQDVLREELEKWGSYHAVTDNGTPGRAVHEMMKRARDEVTESALYTVGPVRFMKLAADEFLRAGGDPASAFVSIETMTRCGIGLCGECVCGGRLTCREGTFFSVDYLQDRGIDITDFEHAD